MENTVNMIGDHQKRTLKSMALPHHQIMIYQKLRFLLLCYQVVMIG